MVVAGEVFLVDCTFCRSWRRCPFAVAMLLGKCFRTRAEVRSGHVVKKTGVITVFYNDTTGLKAALWRYCILSDCLQVRHLGSDLGFLQRKGWGRHKRRIGDGSGWRSISGGLYVFSVLAEVPLCGGYAFG